MIQKELSTHLTNLFSIKASAFHLVITDCMFNLFQKKVKILYTVGSKHHSNTKKYIHETTLSDGQANEQAIFIKD